MADREVLFTEDSTASRLNVSINHRSTNLRFAVVRWPPARGLSSASQALEGSVRTGRRFSMNRPCVSQRARRVGDSLRSSHMFGIPTLVFSRVPITRAMEQLLVRFLRSAHNTYNTVVADKKKVVLALRYQKGIPAKQ